MMSKKNFNIYLACCIIGFILLVGLGAYFYIQNLKVVEINGVIIPQTLINHLDKQFPNAIGFAICDMDTGKCTTLRRTK